MGMAQRQLMIWFGRRPARLRKPALDIKRIVYYLFNRGRYSAYLGAPTMLSWVASVQAAIFAPLRHAHSIFFLRSE